MAGVGMCLDTNRDANIDSLHRCSWTGNIGFAGTLAPMMPTDSFFGKRVP